MFVKMVLPAFRRATDNDIGDESRLKRLLYTELQSTKQKQDQDLFEVCFFFSQGCGCLVRVSRGRADVGRLATTHILFSANLLGVGTIYGTVLSEHTKVRPPPPHR